MVGVFAFAFAFWGVVVTRFFAETFSAICFTFADLTSIAPLNGIDMGITTVKHPAIVGWIQLILKVRAQEAFFADILHRAVPFTNRGAIVLARATCMLLVWCLW